MRNKTLQAWCALFRRIINLPALEDALESSTKITIDFTAAAKLRKTFLLEEERFGEEILAPIQRFYELASDIPISEQERSSLKQRSLACAEQAARAIGDAIFSGSDIPENRYEKDIEWQIGIFITALLFPLIKEWQVDADHALTYALQNQNADPKIKHAMKATLYKIECTPRRFSEIVQNSYDRICNRYLTP